MSTERSSASKPSALYCPHLSGIHLAADHSSGCATADLRAANQCHSPVPKLWFPSWNVQNLHFVWITIFCNVLKIQNQPFVNQRQHAPQPRKPYLKISAGLPNCPWSNSGAKYLGSPSCSSDKSMFCKRGKSKHFVFSVVLQQTPRHLLGCLDHPYLWQIKHQTEISQFASVVLWYENVFRLQIHVNQIIVMKMFDSLQYKVEEHWVKEQFTRKTLHGAFLFTRGWTESEIGQQRQSKKIPYHQQIDHVVPYQGLGNIVVVFGHVAQAGKWTRIWGTVRSKHFNRWNFFQLWSNFDQPRRAQLRLYV